MANRPGYREMKAPGGHFNRRTLILKQNADKPATNF